MAYKEGDFFGELALLTGGKRAASVVAGSSELSGSSGAEEEEATRLLKLRSKDFKRLTRAGSGAVLKSQSTKYKGVDPAVLLALPGLGSTI
jgi:CRP-like cAMP-binding protein